MTFETRVIDGEARLCSKDYDGLFVSSVEDPACARLAADIPHCVVLENANREKSLLVPNYGLQRVAIKACPLNTELVLKSSAFELPVEHWERDEWARPSPIPSPCTQSTRAGIEWRRCHRAACMARSYQEHHRSVRAGP